MITLPEYQISLTSCRMWWNGKQLNDPNYFVGKCPFSNIKSHMMSHSPYIYDKYDCHIGIVYVVKELRAETFFAIKFKICYVIKAQLNSLSNSRGSCIILRAQSINDVTSKRMCNQATLYRPAGKKQLVEAATNKYNELFIV